MIPKLTTGSAILILICSFLVRVEKIILYCLDGIKKTISPPKKYEEKNYLELPEQTFLIILGNKEGDNMFKVKNYFKPKEIFLLKYNCPVPELIKGEVYLFSEGKSKRCTYIDNESDDTRILYNLEE